MVAIEVSACFSQIAGTVSLLIHAHDPVAEFGEMIWTTRHFHGSKAIGLDIKAIERHNPDEGALQARA